VVAGAEALNAAADKEAEIRGLVAQWEGPPVDGATLDQWKRLLAGRRRARGGP
jgi:citrate lyase beta subunit